jgi:uncharacterized membrane protein YjjP (DUF1212 family)
MDLTLLWIALAALVGALSHLAMQNGSPWRQTLITGFITAIIFAAGYKLQGGSLTILDIFFAIIGGYGTNAAVTAFRQNNQIGWFKKTYPDYKNKMNQPK